MHLASSVQYRKLHESAACWAENGARAPHVNCKLTNIALSDGNFLSCLSCLPASLCACIPKVHQQFIKIKVYHYDEVNLQFLKVKSIEVRSSQVSQVRPQPTQANKPGHRSRSDKKKYRTAQRQVIAIIQLSVGHAHSETLRGTIVYGHYNTTYARLQADRGSHQQGEELSIGQRIAHRRTYLTRAT